MSIQESANPFNLEQDDRRYLVVSTHVCYHCARDVRSGSRCICIPSQPRIKGESLKL